MNESLSLSFFTERLASLNPLNIEIYDDSEAHRGHAGAASGGGHYRIKVISACFDKMNRLQRHRLVYNHLNDLIPDRIHALNIEAFTPQEWHDKNNGN